jgi:hypothetical protein
MIDVIGQILWFSMFVVPLLVTPIYYFRTKGNKLLRVFIGLFLSLIICYLLYAISLSVLLRNGLGPT